MAVSNTTGMPFKYFHFRWKSYAFMENIISTPVKFRTNFMGSIEWKLELKCHVIQKQDLADFEFVLRVIKYEAVDVGDSETLESLSIHGFLKFSEKPDEEVSQAFSPYRFNEIYCADFRHPTTACVRNGGFCLDVIMYPNSCPIKLARAFAERLSNDIMDNNEFYAEAEDETMLLDQLNTLVEVENDFTVNCAEETKFTHKFIIYNRLGNFTGEEISENVVSVRKNSEVSLDTTADILDALLRYAYQAEVEPIKRLLNDHSTRIYMLRCLQQHNMWKVYLHLTPDYTRYEVYTLGDQGKQNFSVTFPLKRNGKGQFYNVFKFNVKLQPPTFAEGAVITLNFFGTETLRLCVYVRPLHPTTGVGSLVIKHERTGWRLKKDVNILAHQVFFANYGEVLSKYDVDNPSPVTFDVDFNFCVTTNQGIVKRLVAHPHTYTPLESLRQDMRNAYIRKIDPNCITTSIVEPHQDGMKIAAHTVILKYRLNLPDAWVKSDVPLPLSKESLSLLLEYAYCGTIYIPFASQDALDELEALFGILGNNSPMLQRLMNSLQNLLSKPPTLSTLSMVKHYDELKQYNLVKDEF